jgi:hypothetical protein
MGAYALRDAVTKDPSLLHPIGADGKPDPNYTRIAIDTTDGSMHNFEDTNWKDKDGKDVDMTNHTTYKIMDIPKKDLLTKVPTPNEDINAAMGVRTGDPGSLPAGGKSPWSGVDSFNAIDRTHKRLKEDAATDLEVARTNLALRQVGIEGQKLNASLRTEDRKAFQDSVESAKFLVGSLKERLNDPFTTAEDKKKLNKQIDDANSLISSALKAAHPGLSRGAKEETPPASTDISTASGLLNTVKGYVSPPLQPIVEGYIKGGPSKTGPIPSANTHGEFINNLASSQSKLPAEDRLSPQEYQSVLQAGQSYFDNLPNVQRKNSTESATIKLATVRAKHPEDKVTEKDLDKYDNLGDKLNPGPVYHGR